MSQPGLTSEPGGQGGLATRRLLAELDEFTRKHGIVVWLDKDGTYTALVDQLLQRPPERYAVVGYRHSFLALMDAVQPFGDTLRPERLVIHMPGFTEDDVKRGPLLELYLLGTRYRKALPTLVAEAAHGLATPEQLAAFDGDTLAAADAWLAGLARGASGGLAVTLDALTVPALVDELDRGGGLADAVKRLEDRQTVWRWLGTRLGVDDAWMATMGAGAVIDAETLRFGVMSWALCVEYVHDLRREPYEPLLGRLRGLPRPMITACTELATHLRAAHAERYRAVATEIESRFDEEKRRARAEDLGRIDTFSFEEEKILAAAIVAMEENRWADVLAQAEPRLAERSFWTSGTAGLLRRNAWVLLQDAALLSQALDAAGASLAPGRAALSSLDEAAERYVAVGAAVDRAHRQLLQQRVTRLDTQTPCFEALKAALDRARDGWWTWADAWSRELCDLYRRVGALPHEGAQQRTLFDQVVLPAVQRDKRTVAYFMVDALRYEMAVEVAERLRAENDTEVSLRPRWSELPSVTEVGMNALAPVSRGGRLSPRVVDGSFAGFTAGTFGVNGRPDRRRVISDAVGGALLPWFDLRGVLEATPAQLREATKRGLVLVCMDEIDHAGENGVGLRSFDGALGQLIDAWRRLREAGVKTFVITADHGFLLLDDLTRTAQPHGRKVDPKRRFAWSAEGADAPGELRVRMADLGYDAPGDLHFPETTRLFATMRPAKDFAHGGPTLQERLIPVLAVSHKRPAGGSSDGYRIHGEVLRPVAGMHRIRGRVVLTSELSLAFASKARVQLTLDSPDGDDVIAELIEGGSGADVVPGGVSVSVEEEFELFFRLSASAERKVRLRLRHTGVSVVEPWESVEWVVAPERPKAKESSDPAPPVVVAPVVDSTWLDHIEPPFRAAMEHLERFGDLGEETLASLVGGPRFARLFANKFDSMVARCPFAVEIRTTGGAKRYVRAGGRP